MTTPINLNPVKPKINRNIKGNMLALVGGITLVVFLLLGYFALNYARLQGTNQIQTTAIEAAAITAAADLSRIVYDDPNFGYIALSDHPPIAPANNGKFASDGYPLSVQSINTLLGTILLDSQIVNTLSLDSSSKNYMNQLVQSDYTNAVKAATSLSTLLMSATNGNTNVTDWYDNTVNVLADAQTAYNTNLKNGLTQGGVIQANNLKLSLGYLNQASPTNIPTPNNYYNYTTTGNPNYCYLANQNYSDSAGNNYVFSSIGDSVHLVSNNLFSQSQLVSSQTLIPTIVKASISQTIALTPDGKNNQTVIKTACAQPYNQMDPKPNPGALNIRFPQGALPHLISPISIITDPQSQGSVAPSTGPFKAIGNTRPGGSLVPFTGSNIPSTVAQATVGGLYHWLRHAGVKPIYDPTVAASININVPATTTGQQTLAVGDINTILNTTFKSPKNVMFKVVGLNSPSGATPPGNKPVVTAVYDKWYPSVYTFTFDTAGRIVAQLVDINNYSQPPDTLGSLVNDQQLLFYASPGNPKKGPPKQALVAHPGYYTFTDNQMFKTAIRVQGPNGGTATPLISLNASPLPQSLTNPLTAVTATTPGNIPPAQWAKQSINSVNTTFGPVLAVLNSVLNLTIVPTDDNANPGPHPLDAITTNFKTPHSHSTPYSSWTQFNATIRDNSIKLGKTNGGIQGGSPNQSGLNTIISTNPSLSNFISSGLKVRPSYLVNGTVSDIRFFTTHQFTGDVSSSSTTDYNPNPLSNPNN